MKIFLPRDEKKRKEFEIYKKILVPLFPSFLFLRTSIIIEFTIFLRSTALATCTATRKFKTILRVPIKGANDPRIVGQFGAAASEITGSLSIPRSEDVFANRISLGLIKLKMHFAAALQ